MYLALRGGLHKARFGEARLFGELEEQWWNVRTGVEAELAGWLVDFMQRRGQGKSKVMFGTRLSPAVALEGCGVQILAYSHPGGPP